MEEITMGARLARERKAHGLTQEALATRLGITNQAVSKWESDICCPDIQLLPALADALDLSLDALFGREERSVREEPAPVHIVKELPWADDQSLRAVLYQGHRLLQTKVVPQLSGGGLSQLFRQGNAAHQVVLQFSGTANDIHSAFSVSCTESAVGGSVTAGGGVQCGDVGGDIRAGDGITCGSVGGSVTAGDGITCGDVGGDIRAGDSVQCGNVSGNVTAGDHVNCGNVGGDVNAHDSVRVQGSVGGGVHQD